MVIKQPSQNSLSRTVILSIYFSSVSTQWQEKQRITTTSAEGNKKTESIPEIMVMGR